MVDVSSKKITVSFESENSYLCGVVVAKPSNCIKGLCCYFGKDLLKAATGSNLSLASQERSVFAPKISWLETCFE